MKPEIEKQIINALLDYLDQIDEDFEGSTWDIMDDIYGYEGYDDGYIFADMKLSEAEFIQLDADFKEQAHHEGYYIDDSIYQDVIGAFPFSLLFSVRR